MQLHFEFAEAGTVDIIVSQVKDSLKGETNHLASLMSRVISILVYWQNKNLP